MSPTPVSPERWRRLEELFYASMDLPVNQRGTVLQELCGADGQLRQEVERLLAHDCEESPLIAGIIDETTAKILEKN